MTDVVSDTKAQEMPVDEVVDNALIQQPMARAKDGGMKLAGEGGLLQQLTKKLLESALESEITDHRAEVYGASVSKQTISTITDSVVAGMTEWQNRPLDAAYPVVFIDCVNVKIREGQVANRPVYLAVAVTAEGHRDILGL